MTTDNLSSQSTDGWSRTEVSGIAAGLVWALGILAYSIFDAMGEDGAFSLNWLLVVIALAPLAVIWLWARGEIRTRELLTEIDALHDHIASLREHVDQIEDNIHPPKPDDGLIEKINQIAEAQEKTDTTLAVFLSSRSPEAEGQFVHTPQTYEPQQASLLPPVATDPQNPLSHEDFIRAANFPKSAEDRIGFSVLRIALENDKTSPFINAAQDVLTLLSQDGIYMDDLQPEKTRPEVWRHFGQGKRGKDIAPLGGIRDRKIIEKVSGRMREDMVFRDAVHHFLRKFDLIFTEFCEDASEDNLVQFSETRSGRAFMLLGRIAGTFD